MKNIGLISRLAAVVLISLLLAIVLLPAGNGLLDILGGNRGAADEPVSLQLAWRGDLNGEVAEPYWPCFLELTGTIAPPRLAVSNILTIGGVNAGEVEVSTFPLDAASVPWIPQEDIEGPSGALRGVDGSENTWQPEDLAEDGTVSTLFMLTFAKPGTYEIIVKPYDVTAGQSIGAPARLTLTVSGEGPQLFGRPVLGIWGEKSWSNMTPMDRELGFSISAPTTERWRESEAWGTYYNWAISAICPTGMVVGNDLSIYNTGDSRVDRQALNATSVVSAWESGYNTIFFTVWDQNEGTRLSGHAAMTPTGKELTYSSSAYHAWVTGEWTPFGAGSVTFHRAGHYLLLIYLTDEDGKISLPILMETVVS